jgi:hypothetical protein
MRQSIENVGKVLFCVSFHKFFYLHHILYKFLKALLEVQRDQNARNMFSKMAFY